MPHWPTETLYRGLADVAHAHPEQTAFEGGGETITYSTLVREVRAVAAGLSDLGVSEGETIAIWLRNRPEWIVTQLAASYIGAKAVAVNTRYRRHELEHILDDSDCRVLVTERSFLDTDYLELLSEIAPALSDARPDEFTSERLPALRGVISMDGAPEFRAVQTWQSLVEADPSDAPEPHDDPEAPVTLFYTSGTTGRPKGCVHDSRALLNHSYALGKRFEVDTADIGISLLPFCGIMGHNYVFSVLTRGGSVAVQPHFEGSSVAERVEAYGVTYFTGTDAMFTRTIDSAPFTPETASTLEKGALFFANGYDEDAFERIEEAVGFPVVQPYGCSEANTHIFMGDPSDPQGRRKRVGGPLIDPDEESAKIVDPETGDDVPIGDRGELCLQGYHVMREYLGRPDATAKTLVDGWLHTGDLCSRDESGYFYFHARVDDALRVRGFLVSPREIEEVIDAHPAVEKSQVVGAPHPRHGEVPIAFVIATGTLSEAEIATYLGDRVADYKLPAEVRFLNEFPRTEGPHGQKIQKNVLRERVTELYSEE